MPLALAMPGAGRSRYRVRQLVGLGLALALISSPAFAQAAAGGTSDITTFFQNVVNFLTGTTMKVIAVLVIIGIGLGALSGRIQGATVFASLGGIFVIFSSAFLAKAFGVG